MLSSNNYIIGVDEVGRGSWAGPMVVTAFASPVDWVFPVKDSKKYKDSGGRKAHAIRCDVHDALEMQSDCFWYSCSVSAWDIDLLGLGPAHTKAVTTAIDVCFSLLQTHAPGLPERVIVDGNGPRLFPGIECIPGADDTVLQVSAASVVAKVVHDNFMITNAELYPFYDWENNMGYGTESHIKGLAAHGVSPLHRRSIERVKSYLSIDVCGSIQSIDGPRLSKEQTDNVCASESTNRNDIGAKRRNPKTRGRARKSKGA